MTSTPLLGTLKALFNYSLSERKLPMKSWIKRTLAGIFGASILIGGLSACSRGHHGEWSPERVTEMRGKMIERVSSKLTLNDAQKQKLNMLADEMIASRTALRGKDADPRAEMQAMISGAKFDRSRAQTLLEQKTQVVQGNGPKLISAMADFYDSLNPEQQKQVRDRLEHRSWWSRG